MPAIRRKFTPLERETSGDPASTAMRPREPLDAPLDALIRRTGAQARAFQSGRMRAADHQFQQTLVVGMMDRQGAPGVKFDVEGSGYGFRVVRVVAPEKAELPTTCKMQRHD